MNDRRNMIMETLKNCEMPISATKLGEKLSVSRQIIVGDIALLRAKGENITATPRGYILSESKEKLYVIACEHSLEDLKEEIYTIIDCGCGLKNVMVEHALYGQITGQLYIFSRNDADEFLEKLKNSDDLPLSQLTNEQHFHTVSCPSKKHLEELKAALESKGFLRKD